MGKTVLKEIKIRLPGDIIETVSNKEIIAMLLDKALNKAEYYHSRCKEMEERYGMKFASFKKKVDEATKEKFSDWDDFILWEGYVLGYEEWNKKYEELKNCRG
ncbi:MAG: hypothetical protein ACE5IH_08680 [Thermodesulfobacteriota bacterium]